MSLFRYKFDFNTRPFVRDGCFLRSFTGKYAWKRICDGFQFRIFC